MSGIITEINTAPKQKIKPLFERVIIRPLPKDEKTKGGLYIPDNARVDYLKAIVIACGEDCKVVKEGDTVLVAAELGNDITVDEQACKMLLEKQIDAII